MHFILKVDMHDIASKRVVHEVVQWKLSGATGKEERRGKPWLEHSLIKTNFYIKEDLYVHVYSSTKY